MDGGEAHKQVVAGGCHCGRIRFEVIGAPTEVEQCNCSICAKKAYLHWIIAPERFRLHTPVEKIATYRFNTGAAQHRFCPNCGVAPFYIPRSDPDKIDVNLRCVEGVDLANVKIVQFDGINWEAAYQRNRQRS